MSEISRDAADTESVGSLLRQARRTHGVAVEDAAAVTRISRLYLEALEEERYDRLPSPAYVKGFLRSYGEYLQISGDLLVSLYEKETNPPPAPPAEAPSAPPSPPSKKTKPVVAVVVAVLLLAAFLAGQHEDASRPRPSAQPVKTASPQPAPLPAVATAPPVVADVSAAAPPERSILKLTFHRPSRLVMNVDGDILQEYDLREGDVIEWEGKRLFMLEVDDGAALQGELNGKPLKPFAAGAVRVVVKADGTVE